MRGRFGRLSRMGRGWLVLSVCVQAGAAGESSMKQLADQLRKLDARVIPADRRDRLAQMLAADLAKRIAAANLRSTAEWGEIRDRRDWRRFREVKLKRLRESLGPLSESAGKPQVRISGTIDGDGFRIRNLVYPTREGLWATANLYEPARLASAMPGILLCHSHHAPKEQGELQDMGMTWARAGCLVLVPDLPGHGERRQHPFATAGDYKGGFRVGRQDYYFRYDIGMQLHLAGESLIGWLVGDLRRGVDVLLDRPGIDPERIVILGAVAGGGDPAAVAAALDPRIAAAAVFNFGGPQPESRYPLSDDAEREFNYAGYGSFESTRNLRRSAGEGFLPWVIVGAVAPRRLIYAHEFSWDRPRDPVWRRLERIWRLCGAADRLAAVHGRGTLRGRPPQASHCTNIGPVHRRPIHPLLKRWLGITVEADEEYSNRRGRDELRCMTPALARQVKPKRLCDVLPEIARRRLTAIRARLADKPPANRWRLLRAEFGRVLGDVAAVGRPEAEAVEPKTPLAGATAERIVLRCEPGITVPLVLLLPQAAPDRPAACAVAVAQGGKGGFLQHRSRQIAELLSGGVAVCLPDVRGVGETRPEGSRELWGPITSHSSTELMLGGTMVGARLRDLRSVLRYLRRRGDVDAERIALWGDSFVEPNPAGREFRMPRHLDGRPRRSEPLGGLLAMLGGLYEDRLAAVCVRGGLSDFASILDGQFVYLPHDVIVPGLLTAGDLPDLAAALAPRPLRLERLVDGLNRRQDARSTRRGYGPAIEAYKKAGASERLVIADPGSSAARWLIDALGSKRD